MKYKTTPMSLVSVESGSIASKESDHFLVETEVIAEMDLETQSSEQVAEDRDVFVISLEDCITGEPQSFALSFRDMIKLTKENLMHLSVAGDEVSQKLCRSIWAEEEGEDYDEFASE